MAKQFLRKQMLATRYGVNVRTVERMVKDGRIPKPIYLGKFPLWDSDLLDANDRAAAVARPARQAKADQSITA
jgi:predicted DNA-binding transcriptional regulator AlpA